MATIERRTTSEGKALFRVKVRIKGHRSQSATFQRKTDAKRWAQQTEVEMRRALHFDVADARKHTLGELVDRYIRDVLPTKPKSITKQTVQLTWWKGELGDLPLIRVTPAKLAEARDVLLRTPTPTGKPRATATVVRYMAALSHAFTIAVNEWGWLEHNPLRKVRKPKEASGRVRFLSDVERKRLLDVARTHSNPAIYPVIVLALSTGMRKGEIMNLTWGDIDLKRGMIFLHMTKNGERRVVPLAGHAMDVILQMSKTSSHLSAFLFPSPKRPDRPIILSKAWQSCLRLAEVENFRFHDLRHSAASYLAMNGATLAEIADVLGHKTLAMVKRYAHLSESHRAEVVARMNKEIFG